MQIWDAEEGTGYANVGRRGGRGRARRWIVAISLDPKEPTLDRGGGKKGKWGEGEDERGR